MELKRIPPEGEIEQPLRVRAPMVKLMGLRTRPTSTSARCARDETSWGLGNSNNKVQIFGDSPRRIVLSTTLPGTVVSAVP